MFGYRSNDVPPCAADGIPRWQLMQNTNISSVPVASVSNVQPQHQNV